MQWLNNNFSLFLGILLAMSEAFAAICQLAFPDNKGISGVVAAIIKILQSLGAKNQNPPPLDTL
jgi:hypothetical protein